MKSALLSQKFHSRAAAAIMLAVAALYVVLSGGLNNVLPSPGDTGFAFAAPGDWGLPYWWSLGLNVGLNVLIVIYMVALNRAFNVLRSMTWLHVGLFGLMQGAIPRLVTQLNSGTLVCLTIVLCIYLMFSCFDDPGRVRTVFLAFMLLSLGCATQYCFILFIPIFWLVLAQMRILSLRTFLASLFGILTVWIILFGFGIIRPWELHLPRIVGAFEDMDYGAVIYLMVSAGVTAFMLLAGTMLNIMKTIAYNARARAYNGALTLIALATVGAMLLDFNNLLSYIPLLNMCAAYQITHYFVNHRYDRQYIGILAVASVYVALYLWRLTL